MAYGTTTIPNLTDKSSLSSTDELVIRDTSAGEDKKFSFGSAPLESDNNLSDLGSVSTALGNLSLSTNLQNLTDDEVTQLENIGANTVSSSQWGWLGGLGSAPLESGNDLSDLNSVSTALGNLSLATELQNLTSGEIGQLENIGSVTITNTQWGFLGGMNAQPLEASDGFTAFDDTPGGYTGDANKVAAVNSAEDAVEFTDTLLMGDGTEANPAFSFAADLDTGMFRPAANMLGFSANGDEKVRLEHNATHDSYLIGGGSSIRIGPEENTNTGYTLWGSGIITSARDNSARNLSLTKIGSLDGDMVDFYRNGSIVGSISVSGTSTSYNTSSDHRLKENDRPISGAMERLARLRPVRFNFRNEQAELDGFFAHEVAEVLPEAVTGEKDAVDEDDNPVFQGMDYSKLTPLLTAAIQELESRIAQLENSSAVRQ